MKVWVRESENTESEVIALKKTDFIRYFTLDGGFFC